MAERKTIFDRLNDVFRGSNRGDVPATVMTTPTFSNRDRVIYTTNDRADYEKKLSALR